MFARGERDFQLPGMALGHVDNNFGLANGFCSLFNDATDGTVLGLVGFTVLVSSTSVSVFLRHRFGSFGVLAGSGSPLRIGDADPFGQFFTGTDGTPVSSNPANFLFMPHGVLYGQWFGDHPLALVNPGYSLQFGLGGAAFLCVNLWWTQGKR